MFECIVASAAGMTHDPNDMVWTIEDGERLEAEMFQRLDDQGLGRLLITLVFCQPAGPIQEHVIAVSPLYSERRVGLNAVPLGPALGGSWPQHEQSGSMWPSFSRSPRWLRS